MNAEYEFSRGERVLIWAAKRSIPGVVAYVGRTQHVVIVPDGHGRTKLRNVRIDRLGLRYDGYLAFDCLADEMLSRMP